MRDQNFQPINNLTELNKALSKLTSNVGPISLGMFKVLGANEAFLNNVIEQSHESLYEGILLEDIIKALEPDLARRIDTATTKFIYDEHGDKHFKTSGSGTKFVLNGSSKEAINRKIVEFIQPHIGRIRRDANRQKQNYYLTRGAIPECGNIRHLVIQVDFIFQPESITYHAYPDKDVKNYSLSRTKGGAEIPM